MFEMNEIQITFKTQSLSYYFNRFLANLLFKVCVKLTLLRVTQLLYQLFN